jgi:hypothetical protein
MNYPLDNAVEKSGVGQLVQQAGGRTNQQSENIMNAQAGYGLINLRVCD